MILIDDGQGNAALSGGWRTGHFCSNQTQRKRGQETCSCPR